MFRLQSLIDEQFQWMYGEMSPGDVTFRPTLNTWVKFIHPHLHKFAELTRHSWLTVEAQTGGKLPPSRDRPGLRSRSYIYGYTTEETLQRIRERLPKDLCMVSWLVSNDDHPQALVHADISSGDDSVSMIEDDFLIYKKLFLVDSGTRRYNELVKNRAKSDLPVCYVKVWDPVWNRDSYLLETLVKILETDHPAPSPKERHV